MTVENGKYENDTFFDIHLHAFDLSHPSFSAFLKRLLEPVSLQETIKDILTSIKIIIILVGAAVAFGVFIWFTFVVWKWSFIDSVVVSGIFWVSCIIGIAIWQSRELLYNLLKKYLNKYTNLTYVFENDIGSFFLIIENCLRENTDNLLRKKSKPSENTKDPLLTEDGLRIGVKDEKAKPKIHTYKRIVLTPLMMDFGATDKVSKVDEDKKIKQALLQDEVFKKRIVEYITGTGGGISQDTDLWDRISKAPDVREKTLNEIGFTIDCHYGEASEKPIMGQVADVFNAIKKYRSSTETLPGHDPVGTKYTFLKKGTKRLFEIYPFLGINTQNYELQKIKDMLKKYFEDYTGSREHLEQNMEKFDGHIENIGSNFFAGIKVYPPLGFDPCPSDGDEFEKVDFLYDYCCKKGIPITSHGGGGGFVAIEDKKELADYTSISNWETVLRYYPTLKLNVAHFPAEYVAQSIPPKLDFKQENHRLKSMIEILTNKNYPNVYTDFSCRATNGKYYGHLRKVLDKVKKEKGEGKYKKLKNHILFGTDYAVVLGSIDSYYDYVKQFSDTTYLEPCEKHAFCCINPQEFLFHSGNEVR